jgi:uncharacterized spore protein YtfJ
MARNLHHGRVEDTMNASELLEKIGGPLGSTATVKSVFGEPIQAEGKTVVPVAKIAYGFGAGAGSRRDDSGGGGGGGGICAFPAGALEVTPERTRFIPFLDLRLLAAVFAAGTFIGGLVARRRL